MGYEFKLKKGKTRMNIKFSYVIGIFLLLLLVLPTFASSNAEAQPMNPSTLLETPNVVEDQKEEATPDIPQVSQWKYLNRQILCNTIEVLKTILTTRGQELLATGHKPPEYVPGDPFDAVIITRNPETMEYTILVVKTDQNLACVIASGTSMKTVDEINE